MAKSQGSKDKDGLTKQQRTERDAAALQVHCQSAAQMTTVVAFCKRIRAMIVSARNALLATCHDAHYISYRLDMRVLDIPSGRVLRADVQGMH